MLLLIFKQPVFRVPFTGKYVKVDYGIAPVLGVLVLFATFSITYESLVNGIIGDLTIQPYAILIMFMSLAYICLSLDETGFFAYLALKATEASGDSGRKLFLYFFLLSSFLTLFTSNDIVILTMTPIVYYFAKNAKIDPVPFLIAQFFAANIWSVALYTGNPTNIIVAQAYNLSFMEYFAWMFLPAVAAGASCLALLWVIFGGRVPRRIVAPKVDPRSAFRDKSGAVFGAVCLASCLVSLNLSSLLNIGIWQVSLAFALVVAARDAVPGRLPLSKERKEKASLQVSARILRRMPWKILPFVIGMFIMVEGLLMAGYIQSFASTLSALLADVVSASFGTTFVSSAMANLMSNQPMTIFLTRTLQNPAFAVSVEAEKASMFALILGSNFGANFTLIGSLAGLMWSKLLRDKGVVISFRQFSKYGLLVMPLTLVVSCLVLLAKLLWI